MTSTEPDSGGAGGSEDIHGFEIGTADTDGQICAARSGEGTGREYTLAYEITDTAGNTPTDHAAVEVPVDQPV